MAGKRVGVGPTFYCTVLCTIQIVTHGHDNSVEVNSNIKIILKHPVTYILTHEQLAGRGNKSYKFLSIF